ncbi:MAG: 30S ribosomal protein S20 [Firmicutes bacterium]|nr:30S ribosomal protein S20 [Bacillota bacterium]
MAEKEKAVYKNKKGEVLKRTDSAQKKAQISAEKNARNNSKKSRVKNAIKKYETAIAEKNVALATELLPITISIIDSAKSDGIYKDNTASRKVARISKLLSDLQKA